MSHETSRGSAAPSVRADHGTGLGVDRRALACGVAPPLHQFRRLHPRFLR